MKSWLLALVFFTGLLSQPPHLRLSNETAGLDEIVRALIPAFDHADILALGEWHGRIPLDSNLRIALVRHPDFAKKVKSIVVEFGSTTEQTTLDRYIDGENVSRAQLELAPPKERRLGVQVPIVRCVDSRCKCCRRAFRPLLNAARNEWTQPPSAKLLPNGIVELFPRFAQTAGFETTYLRVLRVACSLGWRVGLLLKNTI